jgi:hypothetical protein
MARYELRSFYFLAELCPRGLMVSEICHMDSSHRNSSKLLNRAKMRSCFLKWYWLWGGTTEILDLSLLRK